MYVHIIWYVYMYTSDLILLSHALSVCTHVLLYVYVCMYCVCIYYVCTVCNFQRFTMYSLAHGFFINDTHHRS
jgi:hypothetical protein